MGNLITTRRSSQKRTSQPIDIGLCSIFDYEELQEATQFFNPSEVVAKSGRAVAIKELTVRHNKLIEQFFNEVKLFSGLRHKNPVTLYGCTNPDDKKMLLVYEFVPNGTVADHLHRRRFPKKALAWARRLQIAIETAEALAYLHSLQPPIIHRDVKTNNILLDNNFNVKVADFGMSRLLPPSEAHISTMPQGTQGYLDPEYNQLYKLTAKSDVYSFGVVLMELISGKAVLDLERADDEIWLVNMAFNKMKNKQLQQLVDPELGYLDDPKIFSMVNSVAELAYQCLQPTGYTRPPMVEILKSLMEISDDGASTSSGGDDNAETSSSGIETFKRRLKSLKRRLTFMRRLDLTKTSEGNAARLTWKLDDAKTTLDDAETFVRKLDDAETIRSKLEDAERRIDDAETFMRRLRL